MLGAASGVAWAGIITALWEPVPERTMDGLVAIAPTVTLLAVVCWLTGGNRYRDDKRGVLIDTVVRLTRTAGRHTGPLRRVK